MLYTFTGQSCTGKSTAAERLKELTGAEIFSGKDYIRMAKNEDEAWRLLKETSMWIRHRIMISIIS